MKKLIVVMLAGLFLAVAAFANDAASPSTTSAAPAAHKAKKAPAARKGKKAKEAKAPETTPAPTSEEKPAGH